LRLGHNSVLALIYSLFAAEIIGVILSVYVSHVANAGQS